MVCISLITEKPAKDEFEIPSGLLTALDTNVPFTDDPSLFLMVQRVCIECFEMKVCCKCYLDSAF